MLIQIDIGGVLVTFGEPNAPNKPEPFYPYLEKVDPIQDSVGEQTGAVTFTLKLKAKSLIGLNLRRAVIVLNDSLEIQFRGVLDRIAYKETIEATVEA